jgi:hypothetical protein
MRQQERGLIDDNVTIGLIDNLELEWWSNGVME